MDFKEAYETLELKFTSGNSIPVERNTILDKEWKAIKEELNRLKNILHLILFLFPSIGGFTIGILCYVFLH